VDQSAYFSKTGAQRAIVREHRKRRKARRMTSGVEFPNRLLLLNYPPSRLTVGRNERSDAGAEGFGGGQVAFVHVIDGAIGGGGRERT
jgi:hypothetical protein